MATNSWRPVRLGDLVEVKHGWAFKSAYFSDEPSGNPIVVNIGNFRYEGGFRFSETRVREYVGDYPEEYELDPGDILLVMTCQTPGGEILGIPARIPDDGNLYLHNQRLGKVVIRGGASNHVLQEFLYFLFLTRDFNQHLYNSASGTKILHTAPSRIESYRFSLPPTSEQRAIAAILGALDDKIELNRRMSETLEAIARELYRAWFADFAAGPAASREFAEELPAGWFFGALADVAELSSESWQVRSAPNAVQYLDLANVKWGRVLGTVSYQWGEAPSRARRILRSGDTIVGTVRPGNGSYAQITQEGLTGSTGFAVLRPKAATTRAITYLAATDPSNIERLAHLADGAAYPAVRPSVVHESPMTVPDQDTLLEFSSAVDPLLNRISVCEAENKTLAELRDALLPKLISGELRIPKAEQLVSEVA